MNAPAPIPQRLDPSTLDALAAGHLTDKAWPEPEPLPPRGDMGEGKPFPLSLLPAALQDAVREVARFNKIPPASPALVGIGALATAIGKRALVIERGGLVHHPALFLVAIGGSGERKSQAFRAMAEPLEQWAVEQTAEWELAVARAQSRNAAVDSEIAKLKRRKNLDLHQTAQEIQRMNAERLPIPPRPRLFTTDCTEERIFQMMHERQGAFAVMSGEGRPVLDAILGKYSGDNRLIPHQARLGSEAVVGRVAVHNALQDRMADTGDLADVRDIVAKAVSQMCKLALVLHLAAQPELMCEPVSDIDAQYLLHPSLRRPESRRSGIPQ